MITLTAVWQVGKSFSMETAQNMRDKRDLFMVGSWQLKNAAGHATPIDLLLSFPMPLSLKLADTQRSVPVSLKSGTRSSKRCLKSLSR